MSQTTIRKVATPIRIVLAVVIVAIAGGAVYFAVDRLRSGQETSQAELMEPDDGEGIVAVPPDTTPTTAAVTPQATDLKATPLPSPKKSPKASTGNSNNGCDYNYGEPTQCVPWVFPDGITAYDDKCYWLKINGFGTLQVVGRDRQRLDPDKNKIACDG